MNKLIGLLIGMMLVFSVSSAQAANIDGVEIDEPMWAEEAMMSQDVGAYLTLVRPTTVRLSNPWTTAMYPYWYQWAPSYRTYRAKAIFNIRHQGNPKNKFIHRFNFGPAGYTGTSSQVFGIADWMPTPNNGYFTIRIVTEREGMTSARIPLYR